MLLSGAKRKADVDLSMSEKTEIELSYVFRGIVFGEM
jgi:hypothetical protein